MDGSPSAMAGTYPESIPEKPAGESAGEPQRSLVDDLEAIIDDGRTYLDAEIQFQKTRVAYVTDRAKDAAIYAAIGGALALLALVALTVGLVFALSPHLTAWGAVAVVTGAWALGAAIFIRMAARRWNHLVSTFLNQQGKGE